jgi:fructose-1,6-bisphosphatase/sedoheptulose 1,7-bisphosphatase-like protein
LTSGLAVLASGEHAAFYSGSTLSGTKSAVDLANAECVNLAAPVRSGINVSSANIDVSVERQRKGAAHQK